MENMIEVRNVSMKFRMSDEPINSLKEIFTHAVKGKLKFNEFLALDDVSFELEKGKTLGLIGKNGAGKSTTLKLISGILKPTEGTIITNGNIVPMLELGAGFDLELTGKENIYLNGAILGYSKEYLESKYDDIIEFAEIRDFIDMPIRNYSSGMMARLAFSIASVVQPEILIVDEILAVGDVAFQEKSFNRMKELMSGGATVLFVSHDLEKIEEMCDKVIWLNRGKVVMFGDTDEVCKEYRKAQGIKE
ncbi:MAG: ABC transporter ATP-binding protein [Erysipelotrichaceae bacterium]|nr:ABC transporter ATP-binding protein [Erysipelotrichaceae bacterium]MBQ6494221.1 ABC transporter ATP-binding protein [Erysipelotrichaceae bacterium]